MDWWSWCLNHGGDDWLANEDDDDDVWWLNLNVMVDELMILWDALLSEPYDLCSMYDILILHYIYIYDDWLCFN